MRIVSLVATLGLASFAALSLFACASETSDASTAAAVTDDGAAEEIRAAVIDEGDNGKTVPVALGRSFTIAMSDNASTGYVWSVTSVDKSLGQPKVTQVAGDPYKPGSSGVKKFTWSTKSPLGLVGTHTIELLHSRAFGDSPSTTFKVTIDIKDTASAPLCGGIAGLTCSGGTFCEFEAKAACGAGDQSGTCSSMPVACPAIELPVCGCDGKSYGNSCNANKAGIAVVSAGACPSAR